jgi:hypothetical protein
MHTSLRTRNASLSGCHGATPSYFSGRARWHAHHTDGNGCIFRERMDSVRGCPWGSPTGMDSSTPPQGAASVSYTLDDVGNRTQRVDHQGTYTYDYDDLYPLSLRSVISPQSSSSASLTRPWRARSAAGSALPPRPCARARAGRRSRWARGSGSEAPRRR